MGTDAEDAVQVSFIPNFSKAFLDCVFPLFAEWGYENLAIGQVEAFAGNVRL